MRLIGRTDLSMYEITLYDDNGKKRVFVNDKEVSTPIKFTITYLSDGNDLNKILLQRSARANSPRIPCKNHHESGAKSPVKKSFKNPGKALDLSFPIA